MSGIRPLTREDLPAVAALYERLARSGTDTPPAELAGYLARTTLDAAWADPDIPPLVAEGSDGGIVGYLGSYPRRFRVDGRAVRVGCSGHLVADPATPGIGALLTRAYLRGPQDVTITDGATDLMRRMWRQLRGRVRTAPSFSWYRVLRPTSAVTAHLGDRGRPVPAPLRTVGGGVDTLVRRLPRLGARPAPAPDPDLVSEPLTVDALVEQMSEAPRHWRLHPDYDARHLTALFAELDAVAPHRGEVVRRLVRGRGGKVVGWYVAFAPPGGIVQVQQLASTTGDPGPVLDHLIADADARGAAAVAGRLEPSLAEAVRDRRCLVRPAAWALVDSEDPGVLAAMDADDTLLTRLDGEWWMGHHVLWREGESA
ncbi:GNAT family N-acetyltransferase [Actinomycetospora aeridis]|uniref:N-acetyltransferase domain-containing protein n=1 Tax=Actinomycetospora aeridis TaxID=3129231 RepID=A0ABU8MZC3_9PSEU